MNYYVGFKARKPLRWRPLAKHHSKQTRPTEIFCDTLAEAFKLMRQPGDQLHVLPKRSDWRSQDIETLRTLWNRAAIEQTEYFDRNWNSVGGYMMGGGRW